MTHPFSINEARGRALFAALVEEAAAAAESLREQASGLTQAVGSFRLRGQAAAPARFRAISFPVLAAASAAVSAALTSRAAAGSAVCHSPSTVW